MKNEFGTEMKELEIKRKELIFKIINYLHRGKINDLSFDKIGIYKLSQISGWRLVKTPITDLEELNIFLKKNIHDISKKLNEPELNMLEFLMERIDIGCSDKKEEIYEEKRLIKEKCSSILMLMEIEHD